MRCLIVDDEPLARNLLTEYVRKVPYLQLDAACSNPLEAMEKIRTNPPDILFLDVQMPEITGIGLLKAMPQKPHVILTTAYSEYALEGYELDVMDYLLKPIDFDRFLLSIQKLRKPEPLPSSLPGARRFYFFNVNKRMVRVWLDEIVCVESLKEYVRLHLRDGRSLVTKGQIGEMEHELGLWRVHRSFMIALAHVEAYSSTEIIAGGKNIPIGRQYKDQTLEKLAHYSAGN